MKRIVVLFWVLLLLFGASSCKDEKEALLQIYALDVGQGDCFLLRTTEGDILIDAGTESSQDLLCLRLEQLGVTKLRLAVFTHPDEDHIGGADGVLRRFGAEEIWINGAVSEEECFTELLRAASDTQTLPRAVTAGNALEIGGVVFFVLSPFSGETEGGNADSIVLKITCGEISAIFTGDADLKTEEALLSQYGASQLDCDLYKVGHHGSNTSTGSSFLEAMSPKFALISSGKGNSYGHPHGDVLAALDAVGARILRVDLSGEILLETDGTELWQK